VGGGMQNWRSLVHAAAGIIFSFRTGLPRPRPLCTPILHQQARGLTYRSWLVAVRGMCREGGAGGGGRRVEEMAGKCKFERTALERGSVIVLRIRCARYPTNPSGSQR